MPILSVFLGIVVRMFHGDHPPPHIHVQYGEHVALIEISSGRVLVGTVPPRVLKLVRVWLLKNKRAVVLNWRRAERFEAIERIDGLE